MNPYVQRVQNMYGKGWQVVFKAELQAAEVDPHFQKKIEQIAVSEKTDTVTIF